MNLFLIEYLTTCPNKRLSSFLGSTLRSSPALRAALERAYKREFIAHAARGRTRNEFTLIRTLGIIQNWEITK